MLPYIDPSYLPDSSCYRNDVVGTPPLPPEPYSSFFSFSPPTFDTHDAFHSLLPINSLDGQPTLPPDPAPTTKDKIFVAPTTTKRGLSRHGNGRKQRALRKDRHSKIVTAQGQRDRRMRLSLEVAEKFFGLQDMLGFDRASTTIDWLLTQSKSAIEQHLTRFSSRSNDSQSALITSCSSPKSESSTSLECTGLNMSPVFSSDYKKVSIASSSSAKEVRPSPSRRTVLHPKFTRETRAEARARARERTREKKKTMLLEVEGSGKKDQLDSSRNLLSHTVEEGLMPTGSNHLKSASELVAEVEDGREPEYLPIVMAGGSSPIHSISNNDDAMNFFQEQWSRNFLGEWDDQQLALLSEVQFQAMSCKAYSINPII